MPFSRYTMSGGDSVEQDHGINGKAAPFSPGRRAAEPTQGPQEQSWHYACSAAWELCDRRGSICDAQGPEPDMKKELDERNKP